MAATTETARGRRPVGSSLERLRRLAARGLIRYRTWRRCGRAHAAPIRAFEPHRVDPGAITHALGPDGRDRLEVDGERIPAVVDGDWDLEAERFVETPLFRSLRARFREGKSWAETAYPSAGERHPLLSGDPLAVRRGASGQTDRATLPERRAAVERLYEAATSGAGNEAEPGAVLVDVGRDGRFLLHAGGHRLAIARLCGIETIPAYVFVRHERWQARRDRLALTGAGDGDHPDLAGLSPAEEV